MYIQVKQLIEKAKHVRWVLVLSICCWLDGDRSKCELSADC